MLAWSNEPKHELLPVPLQATAERALGYSGYLGEPEADERRLLDADDLAAVTADLGGVFSVFRVRHDEIQAATSITRVCPVYYAQDARVTLVGSRALLVHLTAQAAKTGSRHPEVDIDVLGLQPMIRHGFFPNDETPFRGVRALPNAAVVKVRPGESAAISQIPFPEAEPAPKNAGAVRRRLSGLTEALLAAAAPLGRHDTPVTLALSGGRDSRLMAAVLTAAGVPVKATTHGFADDPDVLLSMQVARALGIEHEVRLSKPHEHGAWMSATHPFRRTHHIVRIAEGMTSAYENINQSRPFRVEPRTSGSGGETLRGGFLYDQADLTLDGIRKRLETIFCAAGKFMTPEANAVAARAYDQWAERAVDDRFDVLDKLYLCYRTGRWIVGSHTATLMNWTYYHPFFDNRVVRETLALPAEWRCSEEPFFYLIDNLAPALTAIRPEGKRWKFERNRPRRITEWRAWQARAAVLPNGRTSGFNWRRQYGEELQKIMRDQILGGPRELFTIVDEEAAEQLLSRVPPTWPNQVWNMYTLSVLLSGAWRGPLPDDLPSVTIPLPA